MSSSSLSNQVSVLVVVDSRLRDKQKYPNPNNYVIDLSSHLNDVTKLRLVNATLPSALYSLPASRCSFLLNIGNSSFIRVLMREGDYGSFEDVAEALRDVLVGAGLTDAIVTVKSLGHSLVITSSLSFALMFAEGGPSHFLGFGISGYNSILNVTGDKQIVEAPFKIDLNAHKRYATIEMRQPGGGSQPLTIGGTSSANDAIAVYIFNRDHSISKCERIWDPPLFSFNRIGISLRDEYGGLMDFQNQDHVLEFLVDMRINTNRYF